MVNYHLGGLLFSWTVCRKAVGVVLRGDKDERTKRGVHVASYARVMPSYAEPPNILDVSDERPPKHPGCTAGTPPELFGELSPPREFRFPYDPLPSSSIRIV